MANGKPVMLGEAGWPSAGEKFNPNAVPSGENEQNYTTNVTNAVKSGQLGATFLFEAFDEPWKTGNLAEPHWGFGTRMVSRSLISLRAATK